MSRHVFISYVRENTATVDRLAEQLRAHNLDVWLDREQIKPGQRWREAIREAIRAGELFLACFSRDYVAREHAFMNEELMLAIEELRQMPIRRAWFIPVSLDGCPVPDQRISAVETFRDLQWVDLASNWEAGVSAIVQASRKAASHRKLSDESLVERLTRWGAEPIALFSDAQLVRRLGAKFAIDDVLVDCTFAGFDGVPADLVAIRDASRTTPDLPHYVYETRRSIPEPHPNRTKTYLERFTPPVLDQGNVVALFTAARDTGVASGRYDYWTTKAVVASVGRLQDDIIAGRVEFSSLARRFDLMVVIVTSDRQLLLARRGQTVDNLGGFWMASIGESVDGDVDRDGAGVPNPFRALRRSLTEADELNLTDSDIENAQVTCLGLATEWAYMYSNLILLVELEISSSRLLDRASVGEHSHFRTVDFTPDRCLPIVREGAVESSGKRAPLVPASRVGLLLSLFSRFGFDHVMASIG